MMRGASLRSVAELLGHASMKMTMRYAHLSPAFLSAEVSPSANASARPKGQRQEEKGKKRAKRSRERFCGNRSARFC